PILELISIQLCALLWVEQTNKDMTFIDWSDTEEMLAALIDYVSDAKEECLKDHHRQRFMSRLLTHLRDLSNQLPNISSKKATSRLRDIYTSVDGEFRNDPVATHLRDCIQEFEDRPQ